MSQVNPELAWSSQGDPVAIPAGAQGWRVRRCPSRGGALERVNAPESSAPLVVAIECTFKGFCEAVGEIPGKYRLDAVDERGAIIGDTPAYVTVGGANATHSAGASDDVATRSLETVERLAKTMAETMRDLSTQLSTMVSASAKLIEAADNAGLTTRERAASKDDDDEKPAPVAAAPVDPNKPSPWEPVVAAIMPSLPQLLELGIKFVGMKFTSPPSTASAPKPPPAAAANGTTNGSTNGTASH